MPADKAFYFKRRALLWLLVFSVASSLAAQDRVIKDDVGNTFSLKSPPRRIISLAPNITEILFALGLGRQVVGVTRYCDYPPEALHKEKIGGMLDPDIERIQALDPDLIIGFRGNPLGPLKRLQDLHARLFILDIGMELASVFPLISKIGRVTFKETEAQILIQSLKRKSDFVESALQGITARPRVFLNIHGLGLSTCGRDSYFNDLLAKAKAVNIAATVPQNWLEYNREQLLKDNPEVIIVLTKSTSDFQKAIEWLASQSGFSGIQAMRSGRIYFLDENPASRFGPRLFDSLIDLARLLHPEQFPKTKWGEDSYK